MRLLDAVVRKLQKCQNHTMIGASQLCDSEHIFRIMRLLKVVSSLEFVGAISLHQFRMQLFTSAYASGIYDSGFLDLVFVFGPAHRSLRSTCSVPFVIQKRLSPRSFAAMSCKNELVMMQRLPGPAWAYSPRVRRAPLATVGVARPPSVARFLDARIPALRKTWRHGA